MSAQIVSFHCVLKSKLGQVLSTSYNRDVINQLEERGPVEGTPPLRGLVAGIQNVHEGEHRQFLVAAEDAYGPYDPELVVEVPRSELSKGAQLTIGSEVSGRMGPRGRTLVYRVTEIRGRNLVLDANHPLAGQDLIFDIEVVAARDACGDDFHDPETPRTFLH